jgi:tripartite-type tricarboxylate transporter receptor subunit TctC
MVPYRGAAAALNDLISNSVQLFIDAGVAALQQVRAGRMKVLAITTAERSPLAPEVPTAAESGLPGFVFNSWYGVWAPRGLPPAILEKLANGLQRTVASEEVRSQFTNVGTLPAFEGPAAFTDFMARDIERNVALLRAAKFEPE